MAEIDDIIVKLQADVSEVKKALEKDIPEGADKSGQESGKRGFAKEYKAVETHRCSA